MMRQSGHSRTVVVFGFVAARQKLGCACISGLFADRQILAVDPQRSAEQCLHTDGPQKNHGDRQGDDAVVLITIAKDRRITTQ
eukprot:3263311-Prymnesium_polylepis.1